MATTPQYQTWTCYLPQNDKEVTAKLNEMSLKGYNLYQVVVLREVGPFGFSTQIPTGYAVVQYIFKNSHVDSGR